MHDLKACYRQGLSARIGALEAARKALRAKAPEAAATIRRLAHALRGSGGTYGFPEISAAARFVEEVPDGLLDQEVDRLLSTLRPIAAVEGGKAGILVVEDDPDISRAVQMRLAGPNREIFPAGSIAAAEQILEEHEVALVVLDLGLPDRDGRSLLIRLRERPGLAALPIIVMSGKDRRTTPRECFALGADAYFEKPVDLNTLAAAVATRLQRTAEASCEARQDSMTGLPNRAAFREACERARALAQRNREPLSLGILDLDRFKTVNDTHGHAVGDEVLRRAAGVLGRALRKADLLARWGGEEFVVLLPSTPQKGAVLCLERALEVMRRERYQGMNGATFTVTFSAGVVQYPEDATVDEAVNAADRLLYLAKVAGRNRVLGAEQEQAPGRRKLLFASDDAELARAAQEHLEQVSMHVAHVPGNAAAVIAALDAPTALVILDVPDPALDGCDMLTALRQSAAGYPIPFVVLAANSSEKDIVRSFQMGAEDCLVKPFRMAELVARVRRLLRHF